MNQECISEEMPSKGQMAKDTYVGLYIGLLVWKMIWKITLHLV
jgi:hypothetical protein